MCVGLDTVKNTKMYGHMDALTKCFNIVTHFNRMMKCVSCIKKVQSTLASSNGPTSPRAVKPDEKRIATCFGV